MSEKMPFLYVGQMVNPLSLEELDLIEDGVLVVVDGVIVAMERTSANLADLQAKFEVAPDQVYRLTQSQFLMPGLIDTHIHGPQFPNAGLGYDLPLLDWLDTYTYPLEKMYDDADFASRVYQSVVKRTLGSGTTTACYFATIHTRTALILANAAKDQNQRAFVGKVNMTTGTPPGLKETLDETITQTEEFLAAFPSSDILKPVITPRFALSCDMICMQRLAQIAVERGIHIQTHISENRDEVQAVADAYPQCSSYAAVYDQAGLLTTKTVLAHAVYLSDDEVSLLRVRGAAVSHCPNSNISLQSGLCPVRRLLRGGLKVGLGTDCSGGYSVSMLDAMRQALQTSIAVSFTDSQYPRLTISEVFYMATMGGAQALAIDKVTGSFEVGKDLDAVVVDMKRNPSVDLLQDYSLQQLLQKFIYLGDDRNIAKVYVKGRLSVTKNEP